MRKLIFISLIALTLTFPATKIYPCCGYVPGLDVEVPPDPGPGQGGCGGAGNGPGDSSSSPQITVNTAIGNMYFSEDLTGVGCATCGASSKLTLSYNSLEDEIGPFGRGWTHSYNVTLDPGRAVTFKGEVTGEWGWVYWDVTIWGPDWYRDWWGSGSDINITWDGTAYDWWGRTITVPDGTYYLEVMVMVPEGMAFVPFSLSLGNPVLTRADGREDTFAKIPGSYSAPAGIYTELTKNPDGSFTSSEKDQSKYQFSPEGNLISITDRNNNTTTLSYDAQGRLSTVTDPFGRSTSFSYNGSGLISQITDFVGRTNTFSYDPLNQLTSITNPAGITTSYTYTENNLLSSISKDEITRKSFTYDEENRVSTITDALGNTIKTYTYDPENRETFVTDASGNAILYTYDKNDWWTIFVDALGNTTSYSYDERGNRNKIIDALSRTTQYLFDANGNIIKEIDPLGNITFSTYDAKNNLTSKNRPSRPHHNLYL